MAKRSKTQRVSERKTGNWSGVQGNKRRPGNEGGKQAGQREYTQPSPDDLNSTDKKRHL